MILSYKSASKLIQVAKASFLNDKRSFSSSSPTIIGKREIRSEMCDKRDFALLKVESSLLPSN